MDTRKKNAAENLKTFLLQRLYSLAL